MHTKDNAQFHIVLVKGRVQKDDKFLMAQRSMQELHKPGVRSLPGGKVEDEVERDILQNTLKKEIMEEVGLEITDQIELVYNNSFIRSDDSHVVGLTFLCHRQAGEAQALEDTAKVQRFTLDELKAFPEAEEFLQIEIRALESYLQR
ncbi:MAG: NUDIX domain-containing protein [bacterium]|nr:NUDIX domain-containing protein [bacterium]